MMDITINSSHTDKQVFLHEIISNVEEHSIGPTNSYRNDSDFQLECIDVYCNETTDDYYVLCAILMDPEPGTMNSSYAETFGRPFSPDHFTSGQTDASNNRTRGHHVESAELIDSVPDVARKGDGGPFTSKVSSCTTLLVELVLVWERL